MDIYLRTKMVLGEEALTLLHSKHVAVFGLGGVGGACTEALARCGIGSLSIIDNDIVQLHNINRQIIALHSTLNRLKTEVMKERINDINPSIKVIDYPFFIDEKTLNKVDLTSVDYIIDAIDTVTSKLLLAKLAREENIPILSCMGTGNRVDPSKFVFDIIENTSYCALCRIMRKKCKELKISKLEVLYSKEDAKKSNGSRIPGSVSFVPPVAGMLIASRVIQRLSVSSLFDASK